MRTGGVIAIIFASLFILNVCCQFFDNAKTELDMKLKFVMIVTRHGARSPTTLKPINSTIYSNAWDIYQGDHTQSGNRQHYLLGVKQRKIYVDSGFLSPTYNPKEFMIMSTDFNRTIMSAYSELLGYYPLGSVSNLDDNQKANAVPPFDFNGKDAAVKELGVSPTKYGFQPIPIHVGDIDPMMRVLDSDICPYQKVLSHKFRNTNNWRLLNDKYQNTLFINKNVENKILKFKFKIN